MLIPSGLYMTFGYPGFLGGQPEAGELFIEVRNTFIKKYGKKNVRSHSLPVKGTVAPLNDKSERRDRCELRC